MLLLIELFNVDNSRIILREKQGRTLMFSTVSFHFKVIQTRIPNARTGRTVIHTEGRGILPSYYIEPETHNRRDGGHGKNLRD